jgi:flagellin
MVMGFRINTNIPSLNSQRVLSIQKQGLEKTLERLASGQRINKAADDAAGLAISEKLKGEIRSLRQAGRNANDGVSMIQTAEGGMNEISNILIRLRELSIQAASDTVGDVERGFTDKEFQNMVEEVQRISEVTRFNGIDLLNGKGGMLEIQVGTHNNPLQDRMIYDSGMTDATATKLGLTGLGVKTKAEAQTNLDVLDIAIKMVNENRSSLGALQNRLQSTINNLNVADENLSAANSRIRDADMAAESSELAKYNILTQSGVAVLSQANQNSMMALKLLS